MIPSIPPGILLIIGAALIPLLKGRLRDGYMLLLPILGIMNLTGLEVGTYWTFQILDYDIILGQVDKLSLIFAYIFHIALFIGTLYMLKIGTLLEFVAAGVYAGSAIGVVFAGDWLSFFVFWEMLTLPAVFLVLARKEDKSLGAGLRYIIMHVTGGLILLSGILMHVADAGSLEMTKLTLDSTGHYFMFFGMGINAAWPLVHTWLTDTYPAATIGGTVVLSAFTTKTAVYALARTFPGTEELLWIGGAMVTFPVFFAVIENDLRKVLSFSLINQVGYMMIGIGIGTSMSLNGVAAHAFSHIIYKALLFMSMGAVMYRVGSTKATDLGGLWKSMPYTTVFCIIGALSISGFPLFSGFISKSMVVGAAATGNMMILWFVLLFASAGVLEHAGIKVPFFAFFSHDGGHKVEKAPMTMRLAMGVAAFLCVFIGVFPQYLYALLPYDAPYIPYTVGHVITSMQLLVFAGLAFCLLLLGGVYPAEKRATNLDFDWFYRKGASWAVDAFDKLSSFLNKGSKKLVIDGVASSLASFASNGPVRILHGLLAPVWALQGLSQEEKDHRAFIHYSSFERNAFSIGFACGLGILCVGLFYWLVS